ncbi:hypothetical protein D3C81_1971650 [compost metagenome]
MPHFTSAKSDPEYSVRGPSCSSCSASATSNGILPISINEANPQARNAMKIASGELQPCDSAALMVPMLVEPTISATTSRPRIRIGSTRMPSVSSRLAPIPANELLLSSPERA